ncbi:MAG: aminotransferase class V-fold PLP-dependent enzyme [Verrucomicrobiota bacterium]|nr:aminotransferase class V-fold PLP-dependent enzyme [Verrucomicrobiota bacterium]
MKKPRPARIETLAVHVGHTTDPGTGAVIMPIHLSTTFERAADGSFPGGYTYSRTDNPNRKALEQAMTALEGGAAAAAFASGLAATMSVFHALSPGDHVIVSSDVYHGTTKMLHHLFDRWGLVMSFINFDEPDALAHALRTKTRLVWMETPTNPLLKIIDLAAMAKLTRAAGALLICDNSWAPIVQRPLDLGCDLVMHSTTKYIGGHCDVTGGVLVAKTDDEFFARIRAVQTEGGAVPSPFDCWLVLRGLRALPCRMRAHSENALAVARFLARHANVERVFYPGLASHPAHEIAAKQMSAFSGMLSFEVRGGLDDAMAVAGRTKLFTRATSLGGTESLIEHRASIEGPATRTPQNLLRVSVGLEHADDLIADLEQALG